MKYNFAISTEVEESTGDVLAVYFQIRKGRVAETREVEPGTVFADYSRNGQLLGIELLGPCHFSVLEQLIGEDPQPRHFLRHAAPREMALV